MKYKKVLALLLIVLFTMGSIPVASAAGKLDGGTYGGVSWTLYQNGTLEINGNGGMPEQGIDNPWSLYAPFVKTLILKNGITSICENAFEGFTKIKTVTIPKSIKRIDGDAFSGCKNLKSIKLGNYDLDIACDAFGNTAWWKQQPKGVVYLGKIAMDIKGTTPSKIRLKDGTITVARYAFCYSDYRLTKIELPDSLKRICENAFIESGISSIFIPKSVETMAVSAFWGCKYLSEFCVDSANKFFSADAAGVLFNKKQTTLIRFPIGNANAQYEVPETVKRIGAGAFDDVSTIKTVVFSKKLEKIGDGAFSDCKALKSVSIPNTVKKIGHTAFQGCEKLRVVSGGKGLTEVGGWAFNLTPWFNKREAGPVYLGKVFIGFSGRTPKKTLTIKEGTIGLAKNAFEGVSFEKVVLPESITKISDYAFELSSIKTVVLPKTLTSIEKGAFMSSGITSIALPKGLKTIGEDAFTDSCIKTSVSIPASVTKIEDGAFSNTEIKSFVVDSKNKYYSSLDGVLFNKSKNTLIQYPCGNGNTYYAVPKTVKTIGDRSFAGARIKNVQIPYGVQTIGEGSFAGCPLTSIKLPNSVTSLGGGAFWETNLTSITLSSQITVLPSAVFAYCAKLKQISILGTVKRIEASAFSDCSELKTVILNNGTLVISPYAFSHCDKLAPPKLPTSLLYKPVFEKKGTGEL